MNSWISSGLAAWAPPLSTFSKRNRQVLGGRAAEVAEEGHAQLVGCRAGGGEGDREDGVGAHPPLVGGGVDVDHDLIDEGLLGGVLADHRRSQHVVDVGNGARHAFAGVPIVPVPELDRLERSSGSAGGYGGPSHRAASQRHLGFQGRVAAGVENLPGANRRDGRGHRVLPRAGLVNLSRQDANSGHPWLARPP